MRFEPRTASRRLALAMALLLAAGSVGAADSIGRLVAHDADGIALDTGRIVPAGSRPVITLDHPAVLELHEGARLRLDANSAVTVERVERGYAIAVLSGAVRLAGRQGRELVGGAGGRFVIPPGGYVAAPTDDTIDDDSTTRADEARRDVRRRALVTTKGE